MFVPHPSLGYRKEVGCIGKVYKINHAEVVFKFPQFLLSSILLKQARFSLCLRRKATLLKKVWIFIQYSICGFAHYKVSE